MKVEALIIEAADSGHGFNIVGWDKTNDKRIKLGKDDGRHIAMFITRYWGKVIQAEVETLAGDLSPPALTNERGITRTSRIA